MSEVKASVVLVDLSSIAYPAWHTHGTDANPSATSDFIVSRVLALANGAKHVAVCADAGRSFRRDIADTYKANRPEREPALMHQIDVAIDRLASEGFPVWKIPTFEADDLIATATVQAAEAGYDVTIVSGDKDLLQLVTDRVCVKAVRDGAIFDAAAVVAKFGVTPAQMRDYLCLVGDASDNIKGAKGIGPEKAKELLGRFTSIDRLFEEMDAIGPATLRLTPALATNLKDFRAQLPTTRLLVTLRLDAPIPFDTLFTPMEAKPMAEATEPMAEVEEIAQQAEGPRPVALVPRKPDVMVNGEWTKQLEPTSMKDAQVLAENMHNSRLFMSAYGTPQAVLSTILAGRELGLQAMASLRAIHMVEGKPTLSADLIRALVLRSGLARYFRCTERTPDKATFETQRGDDPPMSLTFTIEEAKLAWSKTPDAWAKSGWGHNPADMLVARAGAKLARLVYPDVVHGIYVTGEIEDGMSEVA